MGLDPAIHALTDGEAAARAILEHIGSSVRALDYEAVRELIPDDGEYFCSFEPFVHGYDELREKQFRHVWPNIEQFTILRDSLRTGAAGNLAWASNRFRSTVRGPDGAELEREGRMSWIFERRDGRWVIVHSHDSLVPTRALRSG